MITVQILQNILKVFRFLAEAVGWTAALGVLMVYLERDPPVLVALGVLSMVCLVMLGAQIVPFIQQRKEQIKIDRANAKSQEPIYETPKEERVSRTSHSGRPQVAPWTGA